MQATLEYRPAYEVGYRGKKLVPDWLYKEQGITLETHKFCPDCRSWTLRTAFCVSNNSSDGYDSYCKDCRFERNAHKGTRRPPAPKITEEDAARGVAIETHKFCKDCETWVFRDNFYRDPKNSDGLGTYCKPHHVRRSNPSKAEREIEEFERRHARLMAITSRPDHEVRAENERRFERMKSKDRTCSCCGEKLGRYTRGAYCLRHATDEGRAAYTRFVRDREMVECGQGVLAV